MPATGDGISFIDMAGSSLKENSDIDFSSFEGFMLSLSGWFTSLRGMFLMLAVIQGFFAGLVIGKLSEGDMMPGLKHSFILMTVAFFVISIAQSF